MGYKEFNKEQRVKDKERHKCITYVDKDKANEILSLEDIVVGSIIVVEQGSTVRFLGLC